MGKTYIEEFVALLGFEIDGAAIDKFQKRSENLKKSFGAVAKVAGIVSGALTGIVAIANRATARTDTLAKSVGISTEEFFGLSAALQNVGLSAESVAGMAEQVTKSLNTVDGNGRPLEKISQAVKILGLNFEELKRKAPADQIAAIFAAAEKSDDKGAAKVAIDRLLGPEASRALSFIESIGGSFAGLIDKSKKYNFLTKSGVDGAVRFSTALGDITFAVQSLIAELAGRLGAKLAPIIEDLLLWIDANRGLIESELLKWVDEFAEGLVWIYETARDLVGALASVIEKLGGLKNTLRLVIALFATFVAGQIVMYFVTLAGAINTVILAVGGLSGAMEILSIAATGLKWLAIFALLALVIQDIYYFLTGKDSLVGDLSKEFEGLIQSANDYWANLMNMDPLAFQVALVGFLEQSWKDYFIDAGSWWADFFADVGSLFLDFVSWWVSSAVSVADFLLTPFTLLLEGIAAIFTGTLPAYFDGLIDSIKSKINSLISLIPESIRTKLGISVGQTNAPPAGGNEGGLIAQGLRGLRGMVPAEAGGPAGKIRPVLTSPKTAPAPAPAGTSIVVNVPTNLAVNSSKPVDPGMLAKHISMEIERKVSQSVRNLNPGVSY